MKLSSFTKPKTQIDRLNRYTTLPGVLDVLSRKKLTLLNPSTWDDENDRYFLEEYRKRKNLVSIFALCFTTKAERYHHWKVFADGSSGVCIEFDWQKFRECLDDCCRDKIGFRYDLAIYKTIKTLEAKPPKDDDLPFLKRVAFLDEWDCFDKLDREVGPLG
jgi:hypothetical protein